MLAFEEFYHSPLYLSSSSTVHNLNINPLPFQGSGTARAALPKRDPETRSAKLQSHSLVVEHVASCLMLSSRAYGGPILAHALYFIHGSKRRFRNHSDRILAAAQLWGHHGALPPIHVLLDPCCAVYP